MDKKERHPLLLPIYLPTLILAVCRGLLIPVLPLYAKSFTLSYGLIGLILAAEGAGMLTGDIPAGVILRRIGRKSAMLLGVGCMGFSVLALFWAQSIPEVIAYRLLTGIGTALWNISRHAYIANVTLLHRRGRALSIFGGIHRIGSFVGPAAGGALGVLYGLQATFLLYAGLAVIPLFTLVAFIDRTDASENGSYSSPATGYLGHFTDMLKTHYRQLATAGAGQLLGQTVRMSRAIIVPLYGADVIGLDVQDVGWILSISSFVDMSMFYPAGLIMDRFGRKYAIVPCFLFQGIGMGLVPFVGSFTGLLLAISFMGLANGIGSGTMMTLGADLAPREHMGEFLGTWRLIGDVGHTASPLIIGGIADLLDLSSSAFAIAGIGLLAAGIFARFVPETLKGRPSRPD